MVTSAPRFDVPDTDNVVNPVAAPSRSKLPVMVKALSPPARVDPKLTVVPVRVLFHPDNVVSPVYVWVDEVVTLPPILDVPLMVKAEVPAALLMVPSRSNVAKV